jgi:uncharacterized protein
MSIETATQLILQAARHCSEHRIPDFEFVFHGGEPLLAGIDFLEWFITEARSKFPLSTRPRFSIQTNGVLLTKEWCDFIAAQQIALGISLDGPRIVNDKSRIDHLGRGSYARVRAGWDLAKGCGIKPGLLAVIDVHADPIATYEHFAELQPRLVDLLLPDGTHDILPAAMDDQTTTKFADWLLSLFKRWWSDDLAQFPIRLFDVLLESLVGVNRDYDGIGRNQAGTLVIETNGEIGPLDVLRICRLPKDGPTYHVATSEFDDVLNDNLVQLYHSSADRLCAKCQSCRVNRVCGGGQLPHRFSRVNGFDNPTIYCADMMKLITELESVLLSMVSNTHAFNAISKRLVGFKAE